MSLHALAAAIERNVAVLQRRPEAGLHDDTPAHVQWQGGTRMLARHANGRQIATDMPTELAGSGEEVTPGWLFRAGLAACAATSITIAAAQAGIELSLLEVHATSRSDARGLFGMAGNGGAPVSPGPERLRLAVRIGAAGVPAERLRALVDEALRCSPIPQAVAHATPLDVSVEPA